MKKILALACTVLLVGAFAIAGCGKTPGGTSGGTSTSTGPQTSIGMDANNFTQHSITVKANTPITLDNTISGGGFHILCVGTGNGGEGTDACDKSGNGPSNLYGSDGLQVPNNTKPTITFPSAGTYHIICTVHAGMFIDVTVQ